MAPFILTFAALNTTQLELKSVNHDILKLQPHRWVPRSFSGEILNHDCTARNLGVNVNMDICIGADGCLNEYGGVLTCTCHPERATGLTVISSSRS